MIFFCIEEITIKWGKAGGLSPFRFHSKEECKFAQTYFRLHAPIAPLPGDLPDYCRRGFVGLR